MFDQGCAACCLECLLLDLVLEDGEIELAILAYNRVDYSRYELEIFLNVLFPLLIFWIYKWRCRKRGEWHPFCFITSCSIWSWKCGYEVKIISSVWANIDWRRFRRI